MRITPVMGALCHILARLPQDGGARCIPCLAQSDAGRRQLVELKFWIRMPIGGRKLQIGVWGERRTSSLPRN